MFGEDRVFYERRDDIREQEIGNSAKLITGGGVSGDVNAKLAELLDEAPDFRASRADFFGDLGAAHDDGGIVGEQADNASKTGVGLLGHGGFRTGNTRSGFAWFCNAEIMREIGRWWLVSGRQNVGLVCRRGYQGR